MRTFFEKLQSNWQPIAVVAVVLLLFGGLIWWLITSNDESASDSADSVTQESEKKGEITSGLINGKDYGTDYALNETATFEVLVVLRDQQASDSGEDRRSSLKRGDVLAVRKSPHLWSDTERTSYLIVRIEMTGREALTLIEPKREGELVVLARAKKIDLDRVGFTGDQVVDGQPLGDQVFEKNVIREK